MSSELKINIPADAIADVVHQAIFDQIGPQGRDALIAEALKQLTHCEPHSSNPYARRSLLQQALERAVSGAAHEIARQIVDESPEVRAKVRELLAEVIERVFGQDDQAVHQTMVELLAEAIAGAIKRDPSR